LSPDPDLFRHQPSPRADGKLPVVITHLELDPAAWTRRGLPPAVDIRIEHVSAPTVTAYRALYDAVGRPWLWYERRLWSDEALQALLLRPGHELHIAYHGSALVGFFELGDDEIVFFGLTLDYIGRRIGPWLLDRAIERALACGAAQVRLNTNTVDHPRALDTYRKAGFRSTGSERVELRDPRVTWPDVYRWPPV
jgi:GNAT superfamily N-acetyltransferase